MTEEQTPFNPQAKQKTYRNEDYIKFIRSQFCLNCYGMMSEAHHVRRHKWGAGTSIKSHDYCTISLCSINRCHSPDTEKLIDCEKEIIKNMSKYISEKYGEDELIEILMEAIECRR